MEQWRNLLITTATSILISFGLGAYCWYVNGTVHPKWSGLSAKSWPEHKCPDDEKFIRGELRVMTLNIGEPPLG